MYRSARSVLLALVLTFTLVDVVSVSADARGLRQVGKVTRAGQDWYHARLKVSWPGISGATYQMRVASSPNALRRAPLRFTPTARGTYTRVLNRGLTWFVQVRARRSGVIGPWSHVRALRFANPAPYPPRAWYTPLPGAVQFNWGKAPYASHYRVRWSPAWFGLMSGPVTYTTGARWLGQYVRRSAYRLPTTPRFGDGQLAVAYANPVFGQVRAWNRHNRTPRARVGSAWVAAWSKPPAPAAGDPVSFGTYNLMLNPTGSRARAAARNLTAHGVTLAALQESKDVSGTAVATALGGSWRVVDTASKTQQIVYRSDRFTLMASGTFKVSNPKVPSKPLVTPWARFTAGAGNSQPFYVASVHYTHNVNVPVLQRKASTGKAARETMAALDKVNTARNPVIVAGDLRDGRLPFREVAGSLPAQPTFIRAGYYDAMASQSMHGQNYSTFNGTTNTPSGQQAPHRSGMGPRVDYILMKGIVGSSSYTNVVNWKDGSVVPSDHNLVYSEIAIPRR